MSATFFYMLRRYRLAIVFWGLGLAAIGILVVFMHESIADKQKVMERIMKGMPLIIKAIAGDVSQFVTPVGWLHLKYFFVLPVSFGVFAVVSGSGLLVYDEEQGRLDLFMAYPLSRSRMFVVRCASLASATFLMVAIAWTGMSVALPIAGLGIPPSGIILPFLSLFIIITFFQALSLCFSFVLPSRIIAAGAAGIILVASFFLEVFVKVEPKLMLFAKLFPLRYYQGGMAIHGLDWWSLFVLLAAMGIALGLAWRLFLKRQIRVMGEGSFPGRS